MIRTTFTERLGTELAQRGRREGARIIAEHVRTDEAQPLISAFVARSR